MQLAIRTMNSDGRVRKPIKVLSCLRICPHMTRLWQIGRVFHIWTAAQRSVCRDCPRSSDQQTDPLRARLGRVYAPRFLLKEPLNALFKTSFFFDYLINRLKGIRDFTKVDVACSIYIPNSVTDHWRTRRFPRGEPLRYKCIAFAICSILNSRHVMANGPFRHVVAAEPFRKYYYTLRDFDYSHVV